MCLDALAIPSRTEQNGKSRASRFLIISGIYVQLWLDPVPSLCPHQMLPQQSSPAHWEVRLDPGQAERSHREISASRTVNLILSPAVLSQTGGICHTCCRQGKLQSLHDEIAIFLNCPCLAKIHQYDQLTELWVKPHYQIIIIITSSPRGGTWRLRPCYYYSQVGRAAAGYF